MRLFSRAECKELDRLTTARYKIPSSILMEHAGFEVVRAVLSILGNAVRKKVLVVCGPGNNGGDGLVAARVLSDLGAEVSVYLTAAPTKGDSKQNYEILQSINPKICIDSQQFPTALQKADCVIDALFGTGLEKPITGEIAALIQSINQSGKPVVAVDIPSGIDADTGALLGVAVKAAKTVTFAVQKTGLSLYPGRWYAGEVSIAYIGIPFSLLDEVPHDAEALDEAQAKSWIPRWPLDSHKGLRGKVMILGGSRGYTGAPSMASTAALHTGSGLVYLGVPDGLRTMMEHKLTEVIKIGFPQTKDWVLGKISLPETKNWFDKIDALALGPGIGRHEETQDYVKEILRDYKGPIVVDADALFALNEDFLKSAGRPSIILTPHEGEMAHLCEIPAEDVHLNRLKLAREKAKQWNVTLVLKGASTIIASGDSTWINLTGNPGMATAGTGDVLTGMIVSLLGQKMDSLPAAVLGVYLHGASGDLLAKERGVHGITASLLADNLWQVFKSLSG